MPSMWTIAGVEYNLTPFLRQHPGGAILLQRTKGQDITTLFLTQHRDSNRLLPLLQSLAVDPSSGTGVIPVDPILKELHDRLSTQTRKERTAFENVVFGVVLVMMCLFYMLLQWRALLGTLRPLPYAVWMSILRICLTTPGKYFIYRRPSIIHTPLSFLMDMDYRGDTLYAYYLRLEGRHEDRRSVEAMMKLPRGYRLMSDILGRSLFPLTSCWMLIMCIWEKLKGNDDITLLQLWGYFTIRGLLIFEIWAFYSVSHWRHWIEQFLLTSLFSFLLMICRSADAPFNWSHHWIENQMKVTVDVMLTGHGYLDAMLTSGLSCHRLHRLCPFHWSPFNDVTAEAILKEICQEKNIEWKPPVHLMTDRLPDALITLFLTPSESQTADSQSNQSFWMEHFSVHSWTLIGRYMRDQVMRHHLCFLKHPSKRD